MKKPPECQGCVLQKRGVSFTTPTGTGENGVLVIGEGPGATGAVEGVPFVGESDNVLLLLFAKGHHQASFLVVGIGSDYQVQNHLAYTHDD